MPRVVMAACQTFHTHIGLKTGGQINMCEGSLALVLVTCSSTADLGHISVKGC